LKNTKILLFTLLLFGCVTVSYADDYVGAALGKSEIDLENYDFGFFYKLYGGIRSKYYGFEGSYNRLAKFEVAGANGGSISTSGMEGALIIFIPFTDNFEIFTKVGVFIWSATGLINGSPISENKGNDLTYGAGIQYGITENSILRIEYQVFEEVIGGEITSASMGYAYRF